MSAPIHSLKNSRLQETCLPSADYNKLPYIGDMKEAAANHANAHATLLRIIASHGLADTFSLRLVHKRFEIPEGRIMVYEKVDGKTRKDFVLCSPRSPQKCPNIRGLHFKAAPGGNMVAYEFTTEQGADLSAHEDFVAEFASAALELGVQDVFALAALTICPPEEACAKFEMDDVLSTVLVFGAGWLPAQAVEMSTCTDWVATTDYAQYDDISTSKSHFKFTCGGVRPGSVLAINGRPLPEGALPYAIITHALQLVEEGV